MQKLTWDEFVSNVQEWAKERGIYEHSTPEAQLLKALSELGELSDAVIKDDKDALEDAIGDVMVCMINFAFMEDIEFIDYGKTILTGSDHEAIGFIAIDIGDMLSGIYCDWCIDNAPGCLMEIANRNGLDFLACCTKAWNEIKDRKGRMVPGGAFVKDEA